eukprot:TRINITY_DN10769_c0_g1_i2.p1 TRINITY_DN10769_c0_g1~~TRINITY_DN10769_c0_g1_i2.p1  ORF type:complete len:117 (-),score=17.79 TRINITY_DN10769_c0_g1_i2:255-605(-)
MLECTRGSDWFQKFQSRWITQGRLLNDYFIKHNLSNYEQSFDVVHTNGKDFVAAHPNSDPIAFDIVRIWNLNKTKDYVISPQIDSFPCILETKGKNLGVGLLVWCGVESFHLALER